MSFDAAPQSVKVFLSNIVDTLGSDYEFSGSVLVHMNESNGEHDFVPEICDGYEFTYKPIQAKLQIIVGDNFYEINAPDDNGSYYFIDQVESQTDIFDVVFDITDQLIERNRAIHASDLASHVIGTKNREAKFI